MLFKNDLELHDLELQRKNENKDGKWCILTVFGMILNCRENF